MSTGPTNCDWLYVLAGPPPGTEERFAAVCDAADAGDHEAREQLQRLAADLEYVHREAEARQECADLPDATERYLGKMDELKRNDRDQLAQDYRRRLTADREHRARGHVAPQPLGMSRRPVGAARGRRERRTPRATRAGPSALAGGDEPPGEAEHLDLDAWLADRRRALAAVIAGWSA